MTRHYHSLVAPSTTVTGHFLSYNHLDQITRAFLAVDVFTGEKRPVGFTMRQSARLARANETYAWWAFKRLAERDAIVAGLIPLMPARPRANSSGSNGHCASLVVPDAGLDDLQLMQIASVVGADRMLAAAVAMEAAE